MTTYRVTGTIEVHVNVDVDVEADDAMDAVKTVQGMHSDRAFDEAEIVKFTLRASEARVERSIVRTLRPGAKETP